MKVSELIEVLQKCPQDQEIYIKYGNYEMVVKYVFQTIYYQNPGTEKMPSDPQNHIVLTTIGAP